MKTTRTKFISLLMALLFCISIFCVPVYALSLPQTINNGNYELSPDSSGQIIFSEGGRLYKGEYVSYTIQIPKTASYILTVAVNQISGDGGVFMIFEEDLKEAMITTNVEKSYQRHLKLNAGTYYLFLQAENGTCSYGALITEE